MIIQTVRTYLSQIAENTSISFVDINGNSLLNLSCKTELKEDKITKDILSVTDRIFPLHTGYFFCPYVPLIQTPII